MLFQPLKPMTVSVGNEAFDDKNYIFEPKYDGWRILIHKQGNRIEAYTRSGNIITNKFPELYEAISAIKAYSAVLDCEGVCIRDGRPVFDDFSYRCRLSKSARITQAAMTHPATFVVFDVLCTDREHLHEPLTQRKDRLHEIIVDSPVLAKTMYVDGQGKQLFALTKEKNMEGIVAKRKDSKYQLDTKTTDWLKIKYVKKIDVIILGYRIEPHFALVVGLNFRTVTNKPVAIVEHGFKPEEKLVFLELARNLHIGEDDRTIWIEPRLCCQIEYLERTDHHQLRTTMFRGFLFDKQASECMWNS